MSAPAAVLTITPAYGWCMLAAAGMAAQVVIIGGMASAARRKYNVAYPDMGCGRHTQKLTDTQWEDFNNHQRAHYNYVEGVASAITLQLLGGLFFPNVSAWMGLLYIVGRQVYAHGYIKHGSKGRMAGAIMLDLGLVVNLGLSIWGPLSLLGYVA